MEVTKKNSGIGITGFVFGIVSLVLMCIMVGGFTGIVGIVLCLIALVEKNTKKGLAIAGLILNVIAVVIVMIILLGSFSEKDTPASVDETSNIVNVIENEIDEIEEVVENVEYATLEKFNQIETGMTYEEVVDIMGYEGTVMSEAEVLDTVTTIYCWYSWNGIANMNVTIVDGKVMAKAQVGLE